jgi:hypothetical protein
MQGVSQPPRYKQPRDWPGDWSWLDARDQLAG